VKPFNIKGQDLEAHRLATQALLSTASLSKGVALEGEDLGGLVAFGVARGAGAERTARNRGADVFVVPIKNLGGGLFAWLGYREEWSSQIAGKSKVFTFRSSGATVHFGFEGVEPKPQMFRAEWAGLVKVDKGWGFQAGDAGHPHWQFDALESLAAAGAAEEAAIVADLIRADVQEPALRDFGLAVAEIPEVKTVASSRAMAAIHFASAAPWWRSSPGDAHAHYPESVQHIHRWLSRTLSYVALELTRV
jgi:hypothetical protein